MRPHVGRRAAPEGDGGAGGPAARLKMRWLIPLSMLLAFACEAAAATQKLEQETPPRLDQLRAIRAGQSSQTIESYNKQMDQVWDFLRSHKPQVLPILREQLKAEMARPQPSDFLLLDIGLFLHENDPDGGKALARDALFRLNTQAPVV